MGKFSGIELSADCAALNPDVVGVDTAPTPLHNVELKPTKADVRAERDLQNQCENWLSLRGYCRRSPSCIKAASTPAKWFVHLHKAKRNPILLDLLIMSGGKCIEIELKTAVGKLSEEQYGIIEKSGIRVALMVRDFDAFCHAVKKWENEIERDSK